MKIALMNKLWKLSQTGGRRLREIDFLQQQGLPQSIRIEEPVNAQVARITLLSGSAIIFLFIGWSACTTVNEVAQAPGQVIPEGRVKKIQHLYGGVIKEILVEEGQIVQAGDSLVELDDGKAQHDLAEARIRLSNLQLQKERIKATLEGRAMDLSLIRDKTQEDVAEQMAQYQNALANQAKEREIIAKQVEQKTSTIEELVALQNKFREKLQIANEALAVQSNLYKKGLVSKLVYLEHKKEVNSVQSEIERNSKEIEKAKSAKSEFEGRLNALDSSFKRREYEELERVNGLAEQEVEQIARLEKRVESQFLRSPIYGVVKGISLFTQGEVLPAGKTVLEIVPITERLFVELNISPKDIGHVKIRQPVHIKFNSFDFSRYGMMESELTYVSATTFLDAEGNPYYKARADLKANYLGRSPSSNIIIPGMTVQASVVTGQKTVLAYLLKPIHSSVSQALSER